MRILILFTFLITNALGNELPDLKNLVVHKIPKIYDNVIFLDDADEEINIQNLDSKLIILNFWATWCEPCKEEMPSLNRLQANQKLKNLKIYPINIGKENLNKVKSFFAELDINNLEPYFDNPSTLAKTFSLNNKKQESNLIDALKITCRKYTKEKLGKRPYTNINLVRI